MNFFRTPLLLTKLYPSLTWRIKTNEKSVFLTFDDGPVPGPTEFVLKTLKEFDAKGTFFCIGDNVRKHPHLFRQIIDNGHEVGNHTFHHLKGWGSTTERYVKDVLQCDEQMKLFHSFNERKLFRPPYGRITRKQISVLKNYEIVMWDVLTHDYDNRISPERCLKKSTEVIRAGSIIVFHDSVKAERNLKYVLPKMLEYLATEKFVCKTIGNSEVR